MPEGMVPGAPRTPGVTQCALPNIQDNKHCMLIAMHRQLMYIEYDLKWCTLPKTPSCAASYAGCSVT